MLHASVRGVWCILLQDVDLWSSCVSVILVSLNDDSSMGFRVGHYPMARLSQGEPAEIHWFVEVRRNVVPVGDTYL